MSPLTRDWLISLSASLTATVLTWLVPMGFGRLYRRLSGSRRATDPAELYAAIILWALVSTAALAFLAKYAVWVVLPASFVVMVLLLRSLQRLWGVGVAGADRDIASGLEYGQALRLCNGSLDFAGVGAAKLTHSSEFEAAVERCRGRVRLLLLHPDSKTLVTAARQANRTVSEYRDYVVESLTKLRRLKAERGFAIQVRFYDEERLGNSPPLFRIMIVNGDLALVSYNEFGVGTGAEFPQLHLRRRIGQRAEHFSFFSPFRSLFDRLWSTSSDWDYVVPAASSSQEG